MAAKRVVTSSINWVALSERVPPHQRSQFQNFKARSDGYLRSVLQNPEKLPEIDWSFYKTRVPITGMVEEFQKQYAALNIPYPPDNVSPQIDALEKDIKNEIATFKKDSDTRIEDYKKQLAHLASLLPYDQMTMEDFRDAFPEHALDPINRPTFWPHDPEEQIGHKSEEPQAASGH